MSTHQFVLHVSTLLLIGALALCLPWLSRREICFGVTVAADFRQRPEARSAYRCHALWVWTGFFAGLVAVVALRARDAGTVTSLAVLTPILFSVPGFLQARRRVLPFAQAPTTIREASLRPRRQSLPGGQLGQLGPFFILAISALILALQWDEIPAEVVFGPLIEGALTCAMLWGLARLMLSRSRTVAVRGAAARREARFKYRMLLVVLAAEYLIAVVFSCTALAAVLDGAGDWLLCALMVLEPIFLIAVFGVVLRTGQGGSLLPETESDDEGRGEGERGVVGDGSDDRFWKWGLFYVNPDDPTIFVEKRLGIGYTCNFGNPWSWVLITAILALLLVYPRF